MITWRIQIFFRRLLDYLIHVPFKIFRLLKWLIWISPLRGNKKILRWLAGLILLTLDVTPVILLYETVLDLVKWKTRPLTETEREIALFVFGTGFPVHLIGLDPRSIPAIKKKTIAYVSFHTINFDTLIVDYTLVHEMVHIWHYQVYGAAYISEAFWAQKWGGGYNYGGVEALKKYKDNLRLFAFNFEQQADIIEDYYRWSKNIPLQWAMNASDVGGLLAGYAEEVRDES